MEIFKHITGLSKIFEEAYQLEIAKRINTYKGIHHSNIPSLILWLQNHEEDKIYILSELSALLQTTAFRHYVVKKEIASIKFKLSQEKIRLDLSPNEYIIKLSIENYSQKLEFLDNLDFSSKWDFILENHFKTHEEIYSKVWNIDWRFTLIMDDYSIYMKMRDSLFYDGKDSPLDNYLHSNGFDCNFISNYDLYTLTDLDELRWVNGSKIFLRALGTHIIINRVPTEMMIILDELRSKFPGLTLSIRPDFNICGDGLRDITILTEALIQGRCFNEKLSDIFPGVTSLYDEYAYENKLIIIHNKATSKSPDEITFEELVEDWVSYDNYVITQMIHLQFKHDENNDYITHIDHEFIFYTFEEYENKIINHKLYGTGRQRVKTFKIDNAEIPYTYDPEENYLYRILQSYFKNESLINEYFRLGNQNS